MVLQRNARPVAIELASGALYGMDMSSIVTIEVELSQTLTKSRETASQYNFDGLNASRLVLFVCVLAFPVVWQKIVAVVDEVHQACNANDDANLAQLKHRHTSSARFHNQAVHNKVGACTDERTDAAKGCCITQWNKELRMG